MPMLRRILIVAAAFVVAAAPAHAMQRPELLMSAGATTLVNGDPGDGGVSLSISSMWPADPPFTFGLMLFADDCGTDLGRLYDQHDGVDLGTVETRHRFAYGAAWRADAALPGVGRWAPFASATWGAYRLQDDARGDVLDAKTSTGFSIGAGVRRPFLGSGALGVSARWHAVERGPSTGWLSAGLDWQWYLGRRP